MSNFIFNKYFGYIYFYSLLINNEYDNILTGMEILASKNKIIANSGEINTTGLMMLDTNNRYLIFLANNVLEQGILSKEQKYKLIKILDDIYIEDKHLKKIGKYIYEDIEKKEYSDLINTQFDFFYNKEKGKQYMLDYTEYYFSKRNYIKKNDLKVNLRIII